MNLWLMVKNLHLKQQCTHESQVAGEARFFMLGVARMGVEVKNFGWPTCPL